MTINVPIENAGLLYINGMALVNNGATAVRVLNGQCRDSTNVNDIMLPSITVCDATVNGINGLDQGSLANNTLYAVFAVGDSTNNNPSGIVLAVATGYSISAGPIMPFGYDMFRLIGHVLTGASADILAFYQTGNGSTRTMTYATLISLVSGGSSTSFSTITLNPATPSGVSLGRIFLQVELTPGTAGDKVMFRPDTLGSSSGSVYFSAPVVGVASSGMMALPESSFASIQYKVSSAGDSVNIFLSAYEDEL